MSGSTPVQFVKAATKEGRRMATNEEKDAAALQGVAAAFGSAPTMWPTSTSSIECTARVTFFLFDFALRLCLFCSIGGPRRELIATSLWEPTGWIDRLLPGIDPRPMTGKSGALLAACYSCEFPFMFCLESSLEHSFV